MMAGRASAYGFGEVLGRFWGGFRFFEVLLEKTRGLVSDWYLTGI